jgi:hypothetical protein
MAALDQINPNETLPLETARDIMHKPCTYARCISKPEPSDAPDTCYNHGLLEKTNPSHQIQLHV